MPSKPETIAKARRARDLFQQLRSHERVADQMKQEGLEPCSPQLVAEYLERNGHSPTCPTCGGQGISKRRTTGLKKPICDRD